MHNAGEVLSDLEAYRKAVQFYFPNAEISFSMNINLTGTPPTEEEMRAPATIKPENATPNIPKPQEPAKEKPDQKKPKPEKKAVFLAVTVGGVERIVLSHIEPP